MFITTDDSRLLPEHLQHDEDKDRAAESAGEVVTADGLLVLPGVIDVHTHTRVASDE